MREGYNVFGKAYGVMLKNDLHCKNSIDHEFLKKMILLDNESYGFLYGFEPLKIKIIDRHELFGNAQKFRGKSGKKSIENILNFTKNIAEEFNVDFKEMIFGAQKKKYWKEVQTGVLIWQELVLCYLCAFVFMQGLFIWQI